MRVPRLAFRPLRVALRPGDRGVSVALALLDRAAASLPERSARMLWRLSTSLGFVLAFVMEAAAQTVSPPPATPLAGRSDWSASAGYATFAFRDIAITSRPMDGSPTTLEGGGPALGVRYERSSRGRRHRFDVTFARASGLEYVTTVGSTPVPAGDRAVRVEGTYDYRAYPARDVVVSGLDLGVGVQSGLAWRSISRRYAPAIEHSRSEREAGVAGVVAARIGRWRRAELEVAWTTGLAIARSSQTHTGDSGVDVDYWGGGWRSDLAFEGRLPIARHAHLGGRYVRGRIWRASSHHTYSSGHHQLTFGVLYVR